MQSADAHIYKSLLDISASTIIPYCQRHGYTYESWVGIWKGLQPWHASYNRIYLINSLIDRGYRGWLVYMDADSIISNPAFPLHSNLDCSITAYFHHSGIEGAQWWNINNGVFALNLASPVGVEIARRWLQEAQNISIANFGPSGDWGEKIQDDQSMLHTVLRSEPSYQEHLHIDSTFFPQFSYQHLRAHQPDFSLRVHELGVMSGNITQEGFSANRLRAAPEYARENALIAFVESSYRLLLSRPVDQSGLVSYANNLVDINDRPSQLKAIIQALAESEEFAQIKK